LSEHRPSKNALAKREFTGTGKKTPMSKLNVSFKFIAPSGACPAHFPDPQDWASFCDQTGWNSEAQSKTPYGDFREWFRDDGYQKALAATNGTHAALILKTTYRGCDDLGVGLAWATTATDAANVEATIKSAA
jgi:hypothetical protein